MTQRTVIFISDSDELFSMLKQIARPFVDTTPELTIRRVVREAYEASLIAKTSSNVHLTQKEERNLGDRVFPPESPPDFTHASFLSGKVGKNTVKKWRYLMEEAYVLAYEASDGDFNKLQQIGGGRITKGIKSDSGFRPVGKYDFSVQGADSNKAWSISLRLAKEFRFPISIRVRWQDKEGAAYPGEFGRTVWLPESN